MCFWTKCSHGDSIKGVNIKALLFSVNHLNQASVFENQRVQLKIVRIMKTCQSWLICTREAYLIMKVWSTWCEQTLVERFFYGQMENLQIVIHLLNESPPPPVGQWWGLFALWVACSVCTTWGMDTFWHLH